LAVVRPGLVTVSCVAGNVTVSRQIDAKPNQINIVNFCFGIPVASSKEVEVLEAECESCEEYPLDTRRSLPKTSPDES